MGKAVCETNFSDMNLLKRGKVRDIYDLGGSLLMIATDRISAFDVVMPDPIPDKGKILSGISMFWFDAIKSMVPNHVISCNVNEYPAVCGKYHEELEGRSMLVKKAETIPVECVVRGYLSGSGWSSYLESGEVCGIKLPKGLKESDRLPEPLFTPSTKEEVGTHDINIDFNETVRRIGKKLADKIKELSLKIYVKGAEIAAEKGIIIADTKFEFGIYGNDVIIIDEVLTPDSSRFWPRDSYKPGGPQLSFDKQYLRDYLTSIKWNKKPPAPSLPKDVIDKTRGKYMEALKRLTGSQL